MCVAPIPIGVRQIAPAFNVLVALSGGFYRPLKPSIPAGDMEHRYLESGWCTCGHHRDDSRRENDRTNLPSRETIRAILGPTYQPKELK